MRREVFFPLKYTMESSDCFRNSSPVGADASVSCFKSSVMIPNLCGLASAFVPLPKAVYPERKGVLGGLGPQWCPTPWKSGFIWISPLRRRQAVSCIAPNLPPATHKLTLIFRDESICDTDNIDTCGGVYTT